MKYKKLWLILLVCAVLVCCVFLIRDDGTMNAVYIDLSEMDVGDVIYSGDLAFEKAPDDAVLPSGIAQSTTEGFRVVNFGGNTSLNKTLVLNSQYRYFWILVNNEGEKMSFTIGNDEYFANVSTGSLYIYSTKAWPATTHTVSFSCDSGLYGSAHAMLCSTQAEVESHS